MMLNFGLTQKKQLSRNIIIIKNSRDDFQSLNLNKINFSNEEDEWLNYSQLCRRIEKEVPKVLGVRETLRMLRKDKNFNKRALHDLNVEEANRTVQKDVLMFKSGQN